MNVIVYSTTQCGICHALMQWLDSKGVSYMKKIVNEDEAAMNEFLSVNDGMIGTPFTVVENKGETHKIAGYDQPKFTSALGL